MRKSIGLMILGTSMLASWFMPIPRPQEIGFGEYRHQDHENYYDWAAQAHMDAQWQRRITQQIPAHRDLVMQESNIEVENCTNTGADKGGTKKKPSNCKCWMPCADEMKDLDEQERLHGDRRCPTYCRRDKCLCKKPCI